VRYPFTIGLRLKQVQGRVGDGTLKHQVPHRQFCCRSNTIKLVHKLATRGANRIAVSLIVSASPRGEGHTSRKFLWPGLKNGLQG